MTSKDRQRISEVCELLHGLQRQRSVVIKSRNMQANRLQAIIAGTLGYSSSLKESERAKKFDEATAVIKAVMAKTQDHPMAPVIRATMEGIGAFNELEESTAEQMTSAAKLLHVAPWIDQKAQSGFGLLSLATIIGETGDLFNYDGPAKVWRRLACAPWTWGGHTLMGATWRGGKYGKLPAIEWETYGYSPRRRSITYLIGECLMKGNFITRKTKTCQESVPGPYRSLYLAKKEEVQTLHPDYPKLRCHRHAMLLCTKLLLKNLWRAWRD